MEIYDRLMKMNRRSLLKGAVAPSTVSAAGGFGLLSTKAMAQAEVRAEILKIPGVDAGLPTDEHW